MLRPEPGCHECLVAHSRGKASPSVSARKRCGRLLRWFAEPVWVTKRKIPNYLHRAQQLSSRST